MPLKTQHDQLPELNLTPMIDIVFLLIIFFLVGTKFAELERNVELEVPRAGTMGSLDTSPARHVINVYRDGTVLIDQREVSMDELSDQLRTATQAQPQLGVIVRGDAQGAFQHVARVLTACRDAGVNDLGISVQPDRTSR